MSDYEPTLTQVGQPHPRHQMLRQRMTPDSMIPMLTNAGLQMVVMVEDEDDTELFKGRVQIGAICQEHVPILSLATEQSLTRPSFITDVNINIFAYNEEDRETLIEDFSNAFAIIVVDPEAVVRYQRVLGVDHSIVETIRKGLNESLDFYSTPEEVDSASNRIYKRYPTTHKLAKACKKEGSVHVFQGPPNVN